MLAKVAYYSYQVRGPSHCTFSPSPHLHIAARNRVFPLNYAQFTLHVSKLDSLGTSTGTLHIYLPPCCIAVVPTPSHGQLERHARPLGRCMVRPAGRSSGLRAAGPNRRPLPAHVPRRRPAAAADGALFTALPRRSMPLHCSQPAQAAPHLQPTPHVLQQPQGGAHDPDWCGSPPALPVP